MVSKNLPLPFKNVRNKRALASLDNVVSFISECVVNEKSKNQLYLLADAERPSTKDMINAFASGMGIKAKLSLSQRVSSGYCFLLLVNEVFTISCLAIWKSMPLNLGNI
jgi:nucleoside-diphosphate-sugar epimerase